MVLKIKQNKTTTTKSNKSYNNEKNKIKKRNNLSCFIETFKFKLFILFDLYTKILLKINLNLIYSQFSNISLTIKGKGFKKLFYESFSSYPVTIYINGIIQNKINYTYNFTEEYNDVELIWFNNINSCYRMFYNCEDIKTMNLSNFNSSEVTTMKEMFYSCSSLVSLNLSNLITSNVKNMGSMFKECVALSGLDLSFFDTSQVEYMDNMFYRCRNLSSLDLSSFDTSNVFQMNLMFNGCNKLTSLNISNFNTSNVKDMSDMFNGCNLLTSIDVSNFNTSKVTSMTRMFSGYKSSIPLNLSNFDTSQVKSMDDMFNGCSNLTSLDLSNFNTSQVTNMDNMFKECISIVSLDLSNFNTSKVTSMSNMFYRCKSMTSLNLSFFDTSLTAKMDFMFSECLNLEYINLKGFSETKLSQYENMFLRVKENIVVCLNKSNDKILGQLNENCYKIYCSDDWKLNQVKLINHTSNCIINNNKYIKKYYVYERRYFDKCINEVLMNEIVNLCNVCGEGFYPFEDDNNLFIANYTDCYKEPEGYYLDKNDSLYKKCYETCESCEKKGDNFNHNCLKCDVNYPQKINLINNDYLNCYKNCSFYHYFDELNIFHCTNDFYCPNEYPNLIINKSECVKGEININISTDILNENILKSSILINEEEYHSSKIEISYREQIIDDVKTGEPIYFNNCINEIKNQNLINDSFSKSRSKYEEINYYNLILDTIENCFTSEYYDKENLNTVKEDVIETKKINITLTTTKNQMNQINNYNHINNIIISLGHCEILLKKFYNISLNETLYIKIINVIQEGMKIPKIEYDVYYNLSNKKLQKLDLSICKNSRISIVIPMNISENFDIINSSSNYYKDICDISEDNNNRKLDIILKDRRKEFIEENKTVCQDYCEFSEYDYIKKIVKCSCEIRKSSSSFAYMNIDKSKLLRHYSDVNNIFNFGLLRCYKNLFKIKRIFLNIGFIIIGLIIISHIINSFIFYLKDINIINEKIRKISSEIKYKNNTIFKLNADLNKEENKMNNINNKETLFNNKFKRKKRSIKNRPISKRQISQNENTNNINNIIIFNSKNIINNLHESESKRKNIDSSIKSLTKVENNSNFNDINDNELNLLTYILAKENDKRTFLDYYISLIKTKHNLLFLFFNNKDYNSIIIKFDLFIFGFALYYAINTAFYSNEIIHKVYEDNGSYKLKYHFKSIIFASFISFCLNIFFKILSLTNDIIINFKQSNSVDDIKAVEKNIKVKFILYFFITFTLLIFFWYYVSMFCHIYRNNQYLLLYNVLLSLTLSILYPFGIYFISGICRIHSLSKTQKDRKCLYDFSQILQKC